MDDFKKYGLRSYKFYNIYSANIQQEIQTTASEIRDFKSSHYFVEVKQNKYMF